MTVTAVLSLALAAPAAFAPSALFGTNMVLQESAARGAVVFGFAPAGAALQLLFTADGGGASALPRQAYNATADRGTGAWEITLEPYVPAATDANNFTLTLRSSSSSSSSSNNNNAVEVAVAHNVSFGTVLLCSGQSNMALNLHPIFDNDTIIEEAHHPEIRLFAVPPLFAATPQPALPTNASVAWQQTTPEAVATFSALCYLTALEIERARAAGAAAAAGVGRPRTYGLVRAAIGSTDVQSWMSGGARAAALATCWTPGGAAALPSSNSHNAPAGAETASVLWNAMIAPLAPNAFAALLWDQGENNAHYCSREQYSCLFDAMVADWRAAFRAPALPVGAVQLGGYDGGGNVSTVRFAQSDMLPRGAWSNRSHRAHGGPQVLAPSYDLGSPPPTDPPGSHAHWIHARNKSEVGRRLGLQVQPLLDGVGGGGGAETSGPVVQSVALRVDAATHLPSAVISLAHATGLALLPAQGCFAFCCTAQRNKSTGLENLVFHVANRHGAWLPAEGAVTPDGTALVVTPFSPVTCPPAKSGCWLASVRYAVIDVPECVLYNKAMLPALPFELPVPWTAPDVDWR